MSERYMIVSYYKKPNGKWDEVTAFKNSVIIADEMQNATPSQMKMLLTRLGTDSKMVVTGDLQQADRPSNNGLLEFLGLYNDFKGHRYVDLVQFDVQDVERHEAVKEILAIYKDA